MIEEKEEDLSKSAVVPELVWQNECQLVFDDVFDDRYKVGEMGLCCPKEDVEIQVKITSWDRSAKHEVFSKLEGVPVRITIERVLGGNV